MLMLSWLKRRWDVKSFFAKFEINSISIKSPSNSTSKVNVRCGEKKNKKTFKKIKKETCLSLCSHIFFFFFNVDNKCLSLYIYYNFSQYRVVAENLEFVRIINVTCSLLLPALSRGSSAWWCGNSPYARALIKFIVLNSIYVNQQAIF